MAEGDEHRVIQAAGAVVWRHGTAGLDVALVHRPRYDDWSHPKGKRRHGEHLLLTALREVKEETGFDVVLGRPLRRSEYQVSGGAKQVSFWAGHWAEPADFTPNDEVDELAWLPVATARGQLSYERDVALLDELAAGPVRTVPLIVLRHAEAGRKRNTAADEAAAEDLGRPLDTRGAADAQTLASVLASYGRCQVISSAAERCLATVRPYAQAAGVPVQPEPALTVVPGGVSPVALLAAVGRDGTGARNGRGGGRPDVLPGAGHGDGDSDGDGAGARLAAEIAVAGQPTLICAHRENLPVIIDAAFRALGAGPPPAEPLGKSEFWVLHSADGRLVAAERQSLTA